MVEKIKRWSPTVAWMILIFLLSNHPSVIASKMDWLDFFIKKTAHVIEYLILVILFFRSFNYRHLDLAIYFSLLFAFTDESHQLFIFGRTGKLRDVAIDFLGISLASLVIVKSSQWKLPFIPTLLRKLKKLP